MEGQWYPKVSVEHGGKGPSTYDAIWVKDALRRPSVHKEAM